MRVFAIVFACMACASDAAPNTLNSLASLLASKNSAGGFQAAGSSQAPKRRCQTKMQDAAAMSPVRAAIFSDGIYEECNGELWDPLGLSNVDDATLAFFREAEIKHGRVAMLASVGYLVGAAGITFPGFISKGLTFNACNEAGVFNAWGKIPPEGRLQIISTALLIELYAEGRKPHYTKGGALGEIPSYRDWGLFANKDIDARLRKAEMKHGRAAMFGIISFLIHHSNPGAVPIIPGLP